MYLCIFIFLGTDVYNSRFEFTRAAIRTRSLEHALRKGDGNLVTWMYAMLRVCAYVCDTVGGMHKVVVDRV